MKVIVVGLGSMGKRRIRLIKKYDPQIVVVGVDSKQNRRKEVSDAFMIETFDSIDSISNIEEFDCAIISTSPLFHAKLINACLLENLHVFSELNLVNDMYEENITLSSKKNLVLFLSSTFLYRDEISYIEAKINKVNDKMNYVYHVGQYLPDWHPWENYNEYFISEKKTNGCRELFAIELPWLSYVFGEIVDYSVIKSKVTDLKINYPDNYLLLIQHESGHKGALAVDVVSRKAVRNLEVYGQSLYLKWDGTPTGLYLYDYEMKEDVSIQLYEEVDKLEGYSANIIENAYMNELCAFFNQVNGGGKSKYCFNDDQKILSIIDKIEE